MENKEYESVIGSRSAPFINRLARRFTLLRCSYGVAHPSLPNYLALIGGSTFGVTSNCTTCYQRARNLIDQLGAAGISWKAYMQGMPSTCFDGARSGRYAKKHNPFIYFTDIRNSLSRCSRIVSFGVLDRDLRRNSLPSFSFITPDLCSDTHDCSIAAGDRFLRGLAPRLMRRLGGSGILIITYDEGSSDAGCCDGTAGGHIATILAGPGAALHRRIGTPADHYSILRLIEDNWHLSHLRSAGAVGTPAIAGFER